MKEQKKTFPKKWGTKAWNFTNAEQKRVQKKVEKVEMALKRLDIDLSAQLKEKLLFRLHGFIYQRTRLKRMPTGPDQRAMMIDLRDNAKAFRSALHNIRHVRIKRTIPISEELKTDQSIRALMLQVRTWQEAANMAIPATKTGPKSEPFLEEFLWALIDIFEEATGQKASAGYYYRIRNQLRGDFPNFAASILDSIKIGLYQDGRSLAENILPRVIKAYRKSHP
jgi:hypothetical protein